MYREAKARLHDPVDAWADVVGDPERARSYKSVRGKGGFVRASWDEVSEIIAAAHIHTIQRYGPDRIAGFSPIPAMSMVSYSAGTRFFSLIGAVILSFYDWYADDRPHRHRSGRPDRRAQFGDWWNAGYLLVWGSNIPITRTPDAHFMTEARYRGQKVGGGVAPLLGSHQIRRPLAARGAGDRWCAGNGDGTCHPQGILGRALGAVFRGLREAIH